MKVRHVLALMILAWIADAAAAERRTLVEVCGATLNQDTIVEKQGGGGAPFGECAISLAGAKLRLLEAALDGSTLSITGLGSAALDIMGTRLRAGLVVDGTFERVRLVSSLFRRGRTKLDLASGDILLRSSTFRDRSASIRTADGAIEVRQAKFTVRSALDGMFGGVDVRFSEFRAALEVLALGTGDLVFISSGLRGNASLVGDERVVVAGNTFLARRGGAGSLEIAGDVQIVNNRVEGPVSISPQTTLIMIANSFEGGRPTIDPAPPTCIIEDNTPRVTCPGS